MACLRSSGRDLAIPPEFETPRLSLRRLDAGDAPFLVDLLNQPSFLANIGDRGVRTPEDALRYLRDGPLAMYERCGFGLWLLSRKSDGAAIGLCGLLRRDTLPDADVGYALLPPYWGAGYASEAVQATLRHAREKFGLRRVVAIVSEGNDASVRVLEKAGMKYEGRVTVTEGAPEVLLFGVAL